MSSPGNALTLDDLAERLTELRLRAGNPSFAEIARRIGDVRSARGVRTSPPGRITVYDAFRTGRSRMDIELVADIVAALGRASDVPTWRHAHATVLRRRAQERNGRISTARAQIALLPLDDEYGMVAHDQQCAELAEELVLRTVNGDQPPAIALVSGLPGVGKTVFARAVARRIARELGTEAVIEAAFRSHAGANDGAPDPGDVSAEVIRLRTAMDAAASAPTIVLLDDVISLDDIAIIASALPPRLPHHRDLAAQYCRS